ncbi:hypothetical protein RJ640_002554 [Escallonia rubra]|uniref:APO domain-containing protein n=1 Tax=Escallonia rubra TaxID=112253 RepID=A0AA88R3X6_9ASTE|nr:hypothetical protein RJ640_002554 [Escallonia rubra]
MAGKGEGAKGDFLGLMQRASKGKRKEGAGEGSSPLAKRPRALIPPASPLVVEDIPIDRDPIFRPRWTIKRGDSGMPHANVSAQHLAHGVLPSDKLILENQPHEAFAMAHVQAAYNAYCYSSQMQERFSMAMDVARSAETDKRAAEAKAEKLDKEVKALKMENADLLNKVSRFERRCEKLKQEKSEIGNKAIHAFLDGTAGDEWLRKRTEDGLSIFQEGFQKAKELTAAKYPNIFLDDIVVPSFDSPSGETAAPVEAGDAVSPGEKSVRSGNAPPLRPGLGLLDALKYAGSTFRLEPKLRIALHDPCQPSSLVVRCNDPQNADFPRYYSKKEKKPFPIPIVELR